MIITPETHLRHRGPRLVWVNEPRQIKEATSPVEVYERWEKRGRLRLLVNNRPITDIPEVTLRPRELPSGIIELYKPAVSEIMQAELDLEREISRAIGKPPSIQVVENLRAERRRTRKSALKKLTQYAEQRHSYLRSRS